MHVELDQDKLRAMGISGQDIAQTLYTELSGATVAQYYAPDKTIDIQLRLDDKDRKDLSAIQSLPVYVAKPLRSLGTDRPHFLSSEDGLIWRRNLKPTVTINGGIKSGTADDATQKAYDSIADIRDNMPFGYDVEVDGSLENSQKSLKYLLGPVPVMVIIIMTLLMFQLRSLPLMGLTLITAPMGLIGVSLGMLLFRESLGFVAYLAS